MTLGIYLTSKEKKKTFRFFLNIYRNIILFLLDIYFGF